MTRTFRPDGWEHAAQMTPDEWTVVEDAARGLGGHLGDFPELRQILKTLGYYTAPGVTGLMATMMARSALEYRERDKKELTETRS